MSEHARLVRLVRERSQPMAPEPPPGPRPGSPGRLFRPAEAVLFDLYGTLFVSASGDIDSAVGGRHDEAMSNLLRSRGLPMSPADLRERFRQEIRGSHARQTGVDHPEVRVEQVWRAVLAPMRLRAARRFALEYELLANPVWPMLGALSLLKGLRDGGVVLGLISNAQFYTPLLFEAFWGVTDRRLGFARDLRLYSYRQGRAKPSPALFELARARLRRRGIEAAGALFVGNDMLNDILPAARAGFQTCLFAGDRRSLRLRSDDPRCAGLEPTVVVASLEELAALLLGA